MYDLIDQPNLRRRGKMNNKDYNNDTIPDGDNKMFSNVVSLGCFCGPAASMEYNGFRSFSGPFDWCCTEFTGILHNIENNFNDFMLRENLMQIDKLAFNDIKNSFLYNHDLTNNATLDQAYPLIKEKYNRRIVKFLDAIKTPTCFIRALSNKEELLYIRKHYREIQELLIRYNCNNEIIYIIPKDIGNIGDYKDIPIKIFQIEKYDVTNKNTVMHMFDQNANICEWLRNRVDPRIIADNLFFENEKLLLDKEKFSSRYNLALSLCNFNAKKYSDENRSKIIIYGAGKMGKIFYDKLLNKKNVIGFIDQCPQEDIYKNIPIYKPGDLKYLMEKDKKKIMVVISAAYDYDKIIHEIKANYSNLIIVSLSELLDKYKY